MMNPTPLLTSDEGYRDNGGDSSTIMNYKDSTITGCQMSPIGGRTNNTASNGNTNTSTTRRRMTTLSIPKTPIMSNKQTPRSLSLWSVSRTNDCTTTTTRCSSDADSGSPTTNPVMTPSSSRSSSSSPTTVMEDLFFSSLARKPNNSQSKLDYVDGSSSSIMKPILNDNATSSRKRSSLTGVILRQLNASPSSHIIKYSLLVAMTLVGLMQMTFLSTEHVSSQNYVQTKLENTFLLEQQQQQQQQPSLTTHIHKRYVPTMNERYSDLEQTFTTTTSTDEDEYTGKTTFAQHLWQTLKLSNVFKSSEYVNDVQQQKERQRQLEEKRQRILKEEAQERLLLHEMRNHVVAPLKRPMDYEQFTIRMNTWQRNEQLIASLHHHTQCPSVAQIQVIWCDMLNPPPPEVANHPSGKVVVEYHTVNSLNERFHILLEPPTTGILSLDDDVIRPCEALDAVFFKWTKAPDQIVGYDDRLHGKRKTAVSSDNKNQQLRVSSKPEEEGWRYMGLSATKNANYYSMVLLRAAFLHRDYMDLYTTHLPRSIYNYVHKNFNCEDIAMSYMISYATNGKPPLLADAWAFNSLVKLYSAKGISTGGDADHKSKRHNCVTEFAKTLDLYEGQSNELQSFKRRHSSKKYDGAPLDEESPYLKDYEPTEREVSLKHKLSKQMRDSKLDVWQFFLSPEQQSSMVQLMAQGLIQNTVTWEDTYHMKRNTLKKKPTLTKEELWFAAAAYHEEQVQKKNLDANEEQKSPSASYNSTSVMTMYQQMKASLHTRPWMQSMCHDFLEDTTKTTKWTKYDRLVNITYCTDIVIDPENIHWTYKKPTSSSPKETKPTFLGSRRMYKWLYSR